MKECKEKEGKKLYFCVGCRTIHYDCDFCEGDGDLEITSWALLLGSVETVRSELQE